jgi:CRP/FNR family transcriptional regulator, cyclic AMP receptor protein
MFKRLLKKSVPNRRAEPSSASLTRLVPGTDQADRAMELLLSAPILVPFSEAEAALLIRHMSLLPFEAGDMLIQQGDRENTGHLLMLLDGDATVETVTVSRDNPMTMTVLSPGSILGEMSVLDGAPRSVSCRADSPVLCASLTRATLKQLTDQAPAVAAKLMMMIAARLTLRLRDNTDKLRLYVQLVEAMKNEVSSLPTDTEPTPLN